jgi:xylulokinase
MLENHDTGAQFLNLQFNIHTIPHLVRAVQEGIAFAFNYGIEIMHGMEIQPTVIRAGRANLFLSPIFADTLAQTAGVTIELYSTDGAQGAARGAAMGIKYFSSRKEIFNGLERLKIIEPQSSRRSAYAELYHRWSSTLNQVLQNKG